MMQTERQVDRQTERQGSWGGWAEMAHAIQAQPLVVTVSGEHGSGREAVAVGLADRLHMLCYDAQLIDRLIEKSVANSSDVKAMHAPKGINGWLKGIFETDRLKRSGYYLHLVRTVMEIASTGGVIIGCGAHLILSGQGVFRLKIEAGTDFCAHRVAQQEGISFAEARKRVGLMNEKNIKRVKEIYDRFPSGRHYYDLVLSAESLSPEEMIDLAWFALEETGCVQPVKS
ncbi:MAG: cytidylate kinase-like family protein [Magnetococcales bacterium]|nr:cytidylate kinase-like family protein [Magnetococcales bacterium]